MRATVVLAVAFATRVGGAELPEPNVWVKVESSESGGRASPIFFYEPNLERFVVATGAPLGTQHYVVEEFDLATGTWTNAYPKDAPDSYAPASGPTKAPQHPPKGWPNKGRDLVDAQDVNRLGFFRAAYSADSRAHFQYAYDPDAKALFAYLWNKTLRYDPAARTWTDLKVSPSPADHPGILKGGHTEMIWGSLCYDPVNEEILSVGGTAATEGGTPGTWAYTVAEKRWRRLPIEAGEQHKARKQLLRLATTARALLAAHRNRFHWTQTEAEGKAKLSKRCAQLLDPLASLHDHYGRHHVGPVFDHVRAEMGAMKALLGESVPGESVARAQRAPEALEMAARALAQEPPGRALSQMAYDASAKKIVLFGGDGLDRHYADTWVYDCATRTWEQRFPKV
ncbi:MAG: Kelch repeat-containing protein, partial [Planctomycetota bacterium]